MVDIWSKGEVVSRILALASSGQVKNCTHLVVKLGHANAFYPECEKNWASREPARDVALDPIAYNGPSAYDWPVCPQDCPEYSEASDFRRSLAGSADPSKGPVSTHYDLWAEIHPSIAAVARSRFEATHYSDAIEAALKEVNRAVKEIVLARTDNEYDGADLMNRAFSPANPVVRLADLSTLSGQDEQKGYMLLFAGTMTDIRNPKAHANLTIERGRAVHLLFLASLLMFKLDERKDVV